MNEKGGIIKLVKGETTKAAKFRGLCCSNIKILIFLLLPLW